MRTEVEWISINACLEDGVSHTAHLVGGIIGALAACCPLGECLISCQQPWDKALTATFERWRPDQKAVDSLIRGSKRGACICADDLALLRKRLWVVLSTWCRQATLLKYH